MTAGSAAGPSMQKQTKRITRLISKDQLQAKLDTSRISSRVDHAERAAVVKAVRPRHEGGSRRAKQPKIHVIDHIERFGVELKVQLLPDGDVLDHRQIDIDDAGISHVRQHASKIAKGISRRIDEGRGI